MFEPADSSLNGNYNPNYPYKTYRFDDPVTIKQFYVKTNSYITDGTDLKLEFFDKNNTKISEKIISKDDYFNEFVELPEPITGVTYIKASYIGWVSIDQIDIFGSLEPTTREPISFKTTITPATTNGTIQVYDDHNLDSNSTTVTIPSGKTFTSSKAWGLNTNFQNYYDWYLVTDESLGIINKWIRINSQREVSNNIFSEGLLDKVDFTGDKGSSIFDNLDYTNLYLSENNITFNSPVNIDQVYVKSYSINNKLTFIFTDSSGNETTYNMTNDDFHYRHFTIPRVENVVSVKIKTANTNNSYINEVDFYDSQR
jgi:hypothetical protein